MLRLTLFLAASLGSLGLNAWMSSHVRGGAGWIGSPLAVLASRAVYGKSQIPWHNGVDETVLASFRALHRNRLTSYFDDIYERSKPDPNIISHRRQSSLEELAKDCETIRIMELAARWDPVNYRAHYDLSFMLRARAHRPDLARGVLEEGLRQKLPPGGKLELLTAKFDLLYIYEDKKLEALSLVDAIDETSARCRDHPQAVDGIDLQSLLLKSHLIDVLRSQSTISF